MQVTFSISEQNYDNIKTAQAALDMIMNYSENESVKQIAYASFLGLCDTLDEMKKSAKPEG